MTQVLPSRSPLALELGIGLAVVAVAALLLQAWLVDALLWPLASVVAYLAVAALVYRAWPDRSAFGWANRITLLRSALVALFVGALALPEAVAAHAAVLALIALIAIVLDGVDGWVARVSGSVTAFGARFDMEIDALLILALSVAVVMAGQGGWWVLAIGLMRYLFLAVGTVIPWWRRDLPESGWRKGVCVAQGLVLSAVLLPWLEPPTTQLLLALALAALGHSFLRDALWLVRNRPRRSEPEDLESRRTT